MAAIADWMRGLSDSLWSSLLRTGAVYASLVFVLFAIDTLSKDAPIWPLSLYTVIWMLALSFPVTTCLYIIFDLRVRLNQVEESAQRNGVSRVYFPDEPDPQRDFRHLLNLKFRQSCNPWELTCFGIAAGVIAFMVQYFPVHEAGVTPAAADISKLPASYWIVLSGFFGAFSGALVLILKKHRTLDIYPTTYFQASIALILGPLVGGFLSTRYMTSNAVGGLITATSFGLGFITATNVNFLGSLLRRQVATVTGVPLPEPTQGDLNTLIQNSEAVESLNNMSCFSVAEFVSMEPIILYLSMPQPINCLDEWLDQGLLVHYFRPHLNELKSVDIKRFTQLLEYVVANFPQQPSPQATIAGIAWRQGAYQITGNVTADETIARATQAIVSSEIHHRLLGVLSHKYRRAFF